MKRASLIQKFIIIASRNMTFSISKKVNKDRKNRFLVIILITLAVALPLMVSCLGRTATNETPTRGNIKIIADESFQPLIETEVFTFTHLYVNAKIKAEYKPEFDVINDFMNDSTKVIVTSKKLTDAQIQYLRDTLVVARTTTFAYDALALVTNKENTDSLMKYNTVKDIFLGKITKWNEINPKSKLGDIRVIFDNTKSGNIRYFKDQFGIKDTLGTNFYAVHSNPEVINFVSRNPDALGIVSVNWISNRHDSLSMSFINKINVVAVSQQFVNDGSYYRPQQGFIYDKSYPFVREVYLISRETFAGLGSGFINWACGEQGQRIVLKSGLVPATMPIRLVQIRH
ncbi:MAG TPA: substrate-binding domain-containing protein [Bacteroidales bacterium]|nr:substrate-binding domain-containing protein [Bacteroidales bacterium]